MIVKNFLLCKNCFKKIQLIYKDSIIKGYVYCHVCKSYFRVNIISGSLVEMIPVDKPGEEV